MGNRVYAGRSTRTRREPVVYCCPCGERFRAEVFGPAGLRAVLAPPPSEDSFAHALPTPTPTVPIEVRPRDEAEITRPRVDPRELKRTPKDPAKPKQLELQAEPTRIEPAPHDA